MAKTIGEEIREWRELSPLSNKEITDKLNRSPNTIYNLYAKTSIDSDMLMKLCEILKHDFFEFFYANPILKDYKNKDVDLLIKERDKLNAELLRKSDLINDLQASILAKAQIISDQKEQIVLLEKKLLSQ
jgi:transcriptional regulator with XRE-family HTH domain